MVDYSAVPGAFPMAETKEPQDALERFFMRVFNWGMALFIVLLAIFLNVKPGPHADIFGYALSALCAISLLSVMLAIVIQVTRNVQFSLGGLFASLFFLNLSLALWIGTKSAILNVIGMAGFAVWLVAMSLWFVSKAVDVRTNESEE